jgi:hypothetical protein
MGDVHFNSSLFQHGVPEDELNSDPTHVLARIIHREDSQEGGDGDFMDVQDNAVGRVEAVATGTNEIYYSYFGLELDQNNRTWMAREAREAEMLLTPDHVEERDEEIDGFGDGFGDESEDVHEAYGVHTWRLNGGEETAEHCSPEQVEEGGREMSFTDQYDHGIFSRKFDGGNGTQVDLNEPQDELPDSIARHMPEDVAIGSVINGTDCYNIRMRYEFTRDWILGFVILLTHWRHDQEFAGNFCPNLNNLDWYFETIYTKLSNKRFKVTHGLQRIIVEMAGWGAQYIHHQTTAPTSWYVRSTDAPGRRILSSYFKCRHAAKDYGEHRSKSTCVLCGCVVKIQDAGYSRTATWIRHVEDQYFTQVYSSIQPLLLKFYTNSILWITDHLKNCPHDHTDNPVGGVDSAYAETSECYESFDRLVMTDDLTIMSHARHQLSILTHHSEEIILSAGYIDVTGTGAGYSDIAGDTLDCRPNKPGHPFVLNW